MASTKSTTMEDMVSQAEQTESAANAEPDTGVYTHTLKKPFTYEGRTYETLTFDLDGLTGKDSVAVESELRSQRITVVIAEYTPEYLMGMAARACTERDERGKRTVSTQLLMALPLRDFRQICTQVRHFLLRAEF